MSSEADIFGRRAVMVVKPILADMCKIVWRPGTPSNTSSNKKEGVLTGAINVNINYQQQVVRRRTLASDNDTPVAVIYPSQPNGTLQAQRLFAQQVGDTGVWSIFTLPGWNACDGTAALEVSFNGNTGYTDCNARNMNKPIYSISGAIVTGYGVSIEAEGLTIVDNVNIEFLQMGVTLSNK